MKRYVILFAILSTTLLTAVAKAPLYIVNGIEAQDIASIPPEDIEHVEMLPADEQTIARYGEQASHGVMLITLRYDRTAAFEADSISFSSYIARQVRWESDEPAARVILRYTITEEGRVEVTQELESTDSRLKRRVLKAVTEAPLWRPASKAGVPVASDGVLSIQLPEGKPMPRQVELVYR